MAIPPYVSHTARVALRFTDGVGDYGDRIWWAYDTGTDNPDDYTTFAEQVSDAYSANLASSMATSIALVGVTVTGWASASAPVGEWEGNVPGTAGGTQLTSSTCFDIQFQVPVRYRGGKPRIYLPLGVEGNLQNPRSWKSDAAEMWVGHWQDFISALETVDNATFGGGNHRCILKGDGSYLPQYTPSSYIGRLTVGSQRKRLTSRA